MYQGHSSQNWGPTTYAQHGDDLMILNLFSLLNITHPSYLDLGAHHPFDISNTALLYERGCRGVNIEANALLLEAFNVHRPEDINICVGVGPRQGTFPFFMYHQEHGMNTFSETEIQTTGYRVNEVRPMPVLTVNQIVHDFCPGGTFPHFLNCDLEGLDFDVLKSADFTESSPYIICVEVRKHATSLFEEMMNSKCYDLVCRMSENLIFIKISLHAFIY